ncbi:MAG: hypothetical protein HUU08_06870 [Candidatus Brocadia sp.]|nr:hypothetical protein [Candidatus Brocadia sp.]
MIDVKQASKLAIEYFASLYENKYHNLNLEEVEISEDGKYWYITLGYDIDRPFSAALPLTKTGREFKRFKIDIGTGKVLSMQVRKID